MKPEAEWQKRVLGIAKLYGYEFYHAPAVDPRRVGGTPYEAGWPDLVLAKPPRVLFVELKAPGNYPSPAQRKWLTLLAKGGLEVGVWWPKDLPEVIRTLGPHADPLVLPLRYRPES